MVLLLFALVIVAVYFFGLTIPLLGPDEPRYSQIAKEMLERGDWITPRLGGFDWFEKPVLLYWLQIVSYKIFGVGEFAARFGSAVFGLGTIFCLWILGKSISDSELQIPDSEIEVANRKYEIWNSEFANRLALIAASSIGLLAFSRGASFDIILTFPITAACVAFFIFDQARRETFFARYFPLAVFYFFIGVALLAKGLVGIVFPFAIVAFYYFLSWKFPPRAFLFSLIWGTILSFAVAAAWYLPMYRANGWKFVDEFFIQHHFQRFTSDKYRHHQPFWFFFLVLPLMTLPWLPFFFAALWNWFKVQSSKFKARNPFPLAVNDLPLANFAFAWLFVPLVFFSFSGSKLPGYILPALPAALIFAALGVTDFVKRSARRNSAIYFLAFLVFAAVAFSLQFVVPRYADEDSTKKLIEAANARGYEREKIVNLYVVSHNAEFYADGRLIRDADGKLKRFDDFSELVRWLEKSGAPQILILAPHKDAENILNASTLVEATVLGDNGDTAIVLLKLKN